MITTSQRILCYCMLMMTLPLHAVRSIFLPKPQGYYQNQYLRPHDDHQNRCRQPSIISGMVSYRQSYKPEAIADLLFGTSRLNFTGSAVPDRSPTDLLADNFGLAQNFQGSLCFKPQLKTLTLDFFYHLNLPSWCEALFVEIGAPLVYSRWNLNTHQTNDPAAVDYFPNCYMSSDPALIVQTTQTLQEAVSGNFLFGDMQTPWQAGRIPFEDIAQTRLADLSIALGADFYRGDHATARVALLTLVPTASKFNPRCVFHPLIGNADRWELGFNLMADVQTTWCELNQFKFYIIGNVTHPFSNHQLRSFDFLGKGPLSRYNLLEEINISRVNGVYSFSTYANSLINGINFATRCARVSCSVQGDFTLHALYQRGGASCELGYNFWGRSQEHLKLINSSAPCNLQGHTYIFKNMNNLCTPPPTETPFFLTACNLDLNSAAAPTSKVHTLFLQSSYHWCTSCSEKTMLWGISGEFGNYGPYKALCEWGVWTQFNCRF